MPDGTTNAAGLSCPSSHCEPGATVIGALGSDGRIHNFKTPMVVDAEFVARAGPGVEARMRFAGSCVEGRCAQWTGHSCGVIEKVLARMDGAGENRDTAALQPCVIRSTCRWFAQSGARACQGCTLVVTDQRAEASGYL